MEFEKLIKERHSIRSYKDEPVSQEKIDKLLEIVKYAPTSRDKKPCEFIVVTEKDKLAQLSEAKSAGSQMIKDAGAAIIIVANSYVSDVWIEDSSIAMTYLHLAAVDLGLGSCWVQIRKRTDINGGSSEEYIKKMFNLSESKEVLAILSLGNI